MRIIDDMIYATGTTLGADDGIAIALSFAILEDDTLSHPELEVVITTDEEVGMKGAEALDTSDLKAKYLINLDNEKEGQILTSCAGGMKSHVMMPVRRIEWEGVLVNLKIGGLKGGHSGADIQKFFCLSVFPQANHLILKIISLLRDLSGREKYHPCRATLRILSGIRIAIV